MKDIRSLNKKKLTLLEIENFYRINDYKTLHDIVLKLIKDKILTPVKNSKNNGKSPALLLSYWVELIGEDNSIFLDEIKYKLSTKFDTSYYLKNISKYKEDREYILRINAFLLKNADSLKKKISLNERSFEIFGKEKFLSKEGGKRIIKNLGLTEEFLNFYQTTVPLAYYSHSKEIPQNVLIIENKDTFYSMRKHLLEDNNKIFGVEISTLVYGGGKNINKTFEDFDICVEPYVSNKDNIILYLGDLDYEGILIYESLKKIFENKYKIKPFIEGYIAMITKSEKMKNTLPTTKEGQNRNISKDFLSQFNDDFRDAIINILNNNEYIPQEILNIGDF